jgi:peptidoglycan/LPS O-acetylase OafA/YrhL
MMTWMKTVGMLLIVFGHVAAWSPGAVLGPINTKQLGVACFVFITAITMAREQRGTVELIVRRLFEVWLLATIVAVALSVAGAVSGSGLQLSNYLPLVLGANVAFDHFPANPTTWYVGTYIHLIVAAAAFRRASSLGLLPVLAIVTFEVAVRAWLLMQGLTFIPYMLLTNWLTPYLLGLIWSNRTVAAQTPITACVVMLACTLIAAWSATVPATTAFPFYLPVSASAATLVFTSLCITALYAGSTLALAHLLSKVRVVPRPVQFIADHTLLIFLAHMPVYYFLVEAAARHLGPWRAPVLGAACVLIPAVISCLIKATFPIEHWRNQLAAMVRRRYTAGVPAHL